MEKLSALSRNEIHWYPMRITYNREMKIKSLLDELNIENFVPMRSEYVNTRSGKKKEISPSNPQFDIRQVFKRNTYRFKNEHGRV